jgi:hypothetical protein
VGVRSAPLEELTAYAPTPDATPSGVAVRASADSCFIMAGQGLVYQASSGKFVATNCDTNSYGAANITYGREAQPCRQCPVGLVTSRELPNSAQFWASDGGGRQGFTHPMSCVTPAGFGMSARGGSKCAAGSWNAAGNWDTCTRCPLGLTTADNASQQASAADCKVAPGFGLADGVIQPCPIGESGHGFASAGSPATQ